MKTKKEITLDFESPEMDQTMFRWLLEGIPSGDRENFEKTLLFNKRFREHFCEWLKAIREPAWAMTRQKGKDE